jgi:hypothetical protein
LLIFGFKRSIKTKTTDTTTERRYLCLGLPGGPAEMLRIEVAEGRSLTHLEKCSTRITNLQRILQDSNQNISRLDREAAERVIRDLREAIKLTKGF